MTWLTPPPEPDSPTVPTPSPAPPSRRRWLLWLLVIGFVWLIVGRTAEIGHLIDTLRRSDLRWLALAVGFQAIFFLAYTSLYRAAFRAVGVSARIADLLPVVFASIFVNVVAPLGGASGAALFADDAARRGQSATRAAAGTVLALAGDLVSFLVVLAVGLSILYRQHDLEAYEVAGAGVLLAIVVGLCSALALGLTRPEAFEGVLRWVQRTVARLAGAVRRASPIAPDWPAHLTLEVRQAGTALRERPSSLARILLWGTACHLSDLAALAALFWAVGSPATVGLLVAGYAVGVLFWIVSPTPQGIGVVEGTMSLVFASLGVPGHVAVAVALAFRGLSFWLPLAAGFFLLRRLRSFRADARPAVDAIVIRAAALLTGLAGVIDILSAVTPAVAKRLHLLSGLVPLAVRQAGHLTSGLAGIGLLVLAGGLRRRKRSAWALTEALLVVTSMGHLLKGLDYEEVAISVVLALWLWHQRAHFYAANDRPSVRQGLTVLAAAAGGTLLYGTAGYFLLDRHFHVDFNLAAAARQTLVMFTQFRDPGLVPTTEFARFFSDSIYLVAGVSLGYALLMLLRPVVVREPSTPEQRDRARWIVERHGRSSLARLTLLEDKSYYFSRGGSMVAYVTRGRGAVALGDPIGPASDVPSVIEGFRRHCERNDWRPAFYQTLPDLHDRYREAGFRSLIVGQEGIVHLEGFTTEGKAGKPFRVAAHRLGKAGYRFEVLSPPLSGSVLTELRAVSDDWLALKGRREKRFSLGWFDDAYLSSGRVAAVTSPGGRIAAFANILPEYSRNEISVDLMRHRRTVEPGTMDFLFLGLMEWARDSGVATFNLGMSPIAGADSIPSDPVVERSLRFVYEQVARLAGYKGLHAYKAKFRPEWSPRFLVYPSPADLPVVVGAMLQAEAGAGLLSRLAGRWGWRRADRGGAGGA